jgi:hypothetical protein
MALSTRPIFAPPRSVVRVSTVPVFGLRSYSSGGTLPKDEIEHRIIEILRGFDKVTDPSKVPKAPTL